MKLEIGVLLSFGVGLVVFLCLLFFTDLILVSGDDNNDMTDDNNESRGIIHFEIYKDPGCGELLFPGVPAAMFDTDQNCYTLSYMRTNGDVQTNSYCDWQFNDETETMSFVEYPSSATCTTSFGRQSALSTACLE